MKRLAQVSVCFVVSAACYAQDPNQHMEELEQAHRSLIQPPVSKSKIASSVTSDLASSLPKQGTTLLKIPIRTSIDQHIFGRMQRDKVPHASMATDEEFARRAWLDATGRIPTVDDLRTFLASKDPNKRDKLVD